LAVHSDCNEHVLMNESAIFWSDNPHVIFLITVS